MKKCPPKNIEIFTGTGGVGKTTLATSRAIYLTTQERKVLLITIDPSKRLKQILNLDDQAVGHTQKVPLATFHEETNGGTLDALLLSPDITLQKIAGQSGEVLNNPILKTLSRPYGGLNEIMAMVELHYQLEKKEYETIVLDTPPGKHFIDFLESGKKINDFFDNSFIDIFKLFGKSINESQKHNKSTFFSGLVVSGIKKLLTYLEKVTGKDFVETFINAILSIYSCQNAFIDSLKLQTELQNHQMTNLFLVTSVEHNKLKEAEQMHMKMKQNMQCDNFLAINRCQSKQLHKWIPNPDTELFQVKASMLERENKLKSYAKEHFENILEFPDIIDSSPEKHVTALASHWENKKSEKE